MENLEQIIKIVWSILVIVGGVLAIIYRKKFLDLQKKYFSKYEDGMNQKLLQGLESRSEESFYRLTIIICSVFIIAGLITIIRQF